MLARKYYKDAGFFSFITAVVLSSAFLVKRKLMDVMESVKS